MAIDYDALFGAGLEYDPCEALKALRPAYMRLIAGESEQKVDFRDRSAWFYQADKAALRDLIRQLEIDCAAKTGVTIKPKRFAATAGTVWRRR